MVSGIAPTAEFLLAVLWLGRPDSDGNTVPAGSSVVVHHLGSEYLATALHVAEDCNFQPSIRRNGQWLQLQWETTGLNQDADVAVLRTPTVTLSSLTPQYGFANVTIGAIGRAMGFPSLRSSREISHIMEMDGAPIPLTTLVSSYAQLGTPSAIHYMGGYVNSGFSGGAVLLPTGTGTWTIAGIITHREGLLRHVLRKDVNTGEWAEDDQLLVSEPSGLLRFAGIGVATDIIDGYSH